MKFKTRNILLLIFFLCINNEIFSQGTLEKQFEYAKGLYNQEQYFDSITEFKRLLFFDSAHEYAFEANDYIGNAYKVGAKFSDAILYYTLAEINAKNDNDLFEAKINIVRANILRRTTERAIQLLDSLGNDKRFLDKKNNIFYWKGWAYIFSDEWQKASEEFAKTDSNKTLQKLCEKVHKEKYSVVFAQIISHFIPGAGQFYTGHYFSGLLSLAWNGLWGYLAVKAFIDNRIFDGFMITNFLWLRFYNGNLQNSKNFAEEKNLEISNKALRYLQFDYVGTKP
jgi:TM2 domain-containing membrane protein YozV